MGDTRSGYDHKLRDFRLGTDVPPGDNEEVSRTVHFHLHSVISTHILRVCSGLLGQVSESSTPTFVYF